MFYIVIKKKGKSRSMETESLNWFRLAKCILTEGTEVLHKLLNFNSVACSSDYHKLWLAKIDFQGRSNDWKVLRNSFDQQFKALDASSQQVVQSLLAKWKKRCRATIRTQLSILNEWEFYVHYFMRNHLTQKDTLKKCFCEIQSLERVNTSPLILEYVNLCQADYLDLVRLIEWHYEYTNNCSATCLNELEFCTRIWSRELHLILKPFPQQEVKFDHQLHKDLQPFSIALQPKIEQLLHLCIPLIFSSQYKHILQTLVTYARYILREKHEMCQTGLQNIFNTWNTNQKNISSEWGNLLQQVSKSTTDIQDLKMTRQIYIQAFSLVSEQQIRDCSYPERRFVLNIKSGLNSTVPQRSLVYQTHGYINLRNLYLTLFSTMHINDFPICPPEFGWSDELVKANHSIKADLMGLKKFFNDCFGHIYTPTLTTDVFENLWTITDSSIHRLLKAPDDELKENMSQKTTELKTSPFEFSEYIKIKLKIIYLNQSGVLFLERSTDEKVEISLSHIHTIDDNVQKLHQYEALKKTTDHIKVIIFRK